MKSNENEFFVKSLKEQVYEYLQKRIQSGDLKPGSEINLERTSKQLGISRTPLRDALLQLNIEGFVIIKPRKGIIVNSLSFDDIKNFYQIIGALESSAILSLKGKLMKNDIKKLNDFNKSMKKAIDRDDFDTYYKYNLKFHNYFLDLCANDELKRIVDIKKKRLYDFQRKRGFVKDWETKSIEEHQKIIDFLEKGKYLEASDFMRNVHWSYEVQERFVKRYYDL